MTKLLAKELKLVPDGISDQAKGAETIERILRNLFLRADAGGIYFRRVWRLVRAQIVVCAHYTSAEDWTLVAAEATCLARICNVGEENSIESGKWRWRVYRAGVLP